MACFVMTFNLKNPEKRFLCGGPNRPPDKPGFYSGHLVAVIENKYLVDSSISQFERPEIPLPDILVNQINRNFRRGNAGLCTVFPNHSVVIYQPTFDNGSWQFLPGWSTYPITTENILKVMNGYLN